MTTSFYAEPPTIPEGMTVAAYRRARVARRKRSRSLLRPWRLHVLALALAALALWPSVAGARPSSSGTAVVQGCHERSGQMPGDVGAIRKRVPRRFGLYRDPLSGKPLLNVRVVRCRGIAANGTSGPMTAAVLSVMIESPDGTGCTSRTPIVPVHAVVGSVPPFNWCNYYVIFIASSSSHFVKWLRYGTPEFPARYVPDFLWQDAKPVLATPYRPFQFEAAAPTPSPFEIDAFATRELVGDIPVSAGFWAETSRGLVKVNPMVNASYGDLQGTLRTQPGTEIAELVGAETTSFVPGYSLFGSFRFDGVFRKEIVPAAGLSSPTSACNGRPATIVGSGRIRGTTGDDVIVGGAGRDLIAGRGGNDRICGGGSRDRLRGGPGRDRLATAGGGRDSVDCGSGADRAAVDERDRLRSCERVRGISGSSS